MIKTSMQLKEKNEQNMRVKFFAEINQILYHANFQMKLKRVLWGEN